MSTRLLLISLCMATITLGCFDQLKSESSSESPTTVAVDSPQSECDEDYLEDLEEACDEGEEEACIALREVLAECEDWGDDEDEDEDDRCEEVEERYEEAVAEYGECVLTRGEEACEELADELESILEAIEAFL